MFAFVLNSGPRNFIHDAWVRLSRLPKGNVVYSRIVGRMVPYTGSIGAEVLELGEGEALVRMSDRRAVRNHLRSIHAVAIANLAEFATGLALNYSTPPKARSILTRLQMDYVKKARGTLTARTRFDLPEWGPKQEIIVRGEVVNPAGDVVATVTATWLVESL